ncbi:MAG TPA: zinc-binding dehydrogenase [Candidatus Dormibacteraeota bacterium]|nr:zinc-binding dehydrogenase [Candidatus Dormibacteraeota bacterium]
MLPGGSRVELREFPDPVPGIGEVVVRIKASSICGSDVRAIYREHLGKGAEGYVDGTIGGHEPCGQVESVGPGVTSVGPGDRVAIYHIVGCGHCRDCRGGYMISCSSPQRAAHGWQRDGGHADLMLTNERALLHLPDELSYVDGALVACGFGTAWQGVLRAGVSGRDRVLVTGLGPVGLATMLLSIASGAEVYGVDVNPARRDFAERLGAEATWGPDEALVGIRERTAGKGVEVAIDCSAAPTARRLCLEATRQWGRIVYVGEGGEVTFAPSPTLIHHQLTLMGSWVTGLVEMEALLEFLVRKDLHPEVTVTHRFTLEETGEAYRMFEAGETAGKVVIVP